MAQKMAYIYESQEDIISWFNVQKKSRKSEVTFKTSIICFVLTASLLSVSVKIHANIKMAYCVYIN